MKKIIALILAVIMTFGLCACGETASTTTAAANQGSQDVQPEGYAFTYKGTTIAMHAKMADVLAAIGKEKSYFESESCAFKGLDKEYTYDNFVIKTYPVDGVDYVLEIDLTSDLAETPEGISIGATKDQVVAKYGNDFHTIGSAGYQYEKADSYLLFVFDEATDKVQSIQYYAVTK